MTLRANLLRRETQTNLCLHRQDLQEENSPKNRRDGEIIKKNCLQKSFTFISWSFLEIVFFQEEIWVFSPRYFKYWRNGLLFKCILWFYESIKFHKFEILSPIFSKPCCSLNFICYSNKTFKSKLNFELIQTFPI